MYDYDIYGIIDLLDDAGMSIDTQGMKYLAGNLDKVNKIINNLDYNATFDDFYAAVRKEMPELYRHTDYGEMGRITPYQKRVIQGKPALTGFDAQPTAPMRNPSRLTKFENPNSLKPLAGNITKNTMRGGAHLIPIVGAGLTAMDIYQGLNQPVGAGTLDWNQMTPQQQQKRIEGYQQVQDIIDNIQARQRVQQQYNQNQADMIRRARFGI